MFFFNLILNFLHLCLYLLVLSQIRTVLEIITTGPGDGTLLLDLNPRLFDCDFILNRFYFFWTNFFYLYYFLIMILLYFKVYNFLQKSLQPLLLLLFFPTKDLILLFYLYLENFLLLPFTICK